MSAIKGERVFVCVQCGESFKESDNSEGVCRFHTLPESSSCCGSSVPCAESRHRAAHHCDYPYGEFISRFRDVTNYVDTREEWCVSEDPGATHSELQKASIMLIKRFKTRTAPLAEPLLAVQVQWPWTNSKYFFKWYTAAQLSKLRPSSSALIYSSFSGGGGGGGGGGAMAEWVFGEDGALTGVRLTVGCPAPPPPLDVTLTPHSLSLSLSLSPPLFALCPASRPPRPHLGCF